MPLNRRDFLHSAALLAGGAVVAPGSAAGQESTPPAATATGWDAVRAEFDLAPDAVHLSAMLLASHPRAVREAVARYRQGLDRDPVRFLEQNDARLSRAVREAAGRYVGVPARAIALTDSTTMSVGLVYAGLRLEAEDEILTTEQDYFVTVEATRLAAERTGASLRRVSLYDDLAEATPDSLTEAVFAGIGPATRVVALTWVHSSTGLKLPIGAIGQRIAELNAGRDEARQVLLAVDGVHAFGIEPFDLAGLGADFLMAGTHKWLFGPRGTGIIAASEKGLAASSAVVPSFDDDGVFLAWLSGEEPDSVSDGRTLTPGGFKPFEHRWAVADAFAFHQRLGRAEVAARTHELAGMLKQGLAALPGIALATPLEPELSAGIVSFNVAGYSPEGAVKALRAQQVIASAAPYRESYVRLTPSIYNSERDIEAALAAVRGLA